MDGPAFTCPLPEGSGSQMIYRNKSQITFCKTESNDVCPIDYECIQALSPPYDENTPDGVCCPTRETSCAMPIADHKNDGGRLRRWGFNGHRCVAFSWNPERPSTANNFKTKLHCEYSCINDLGFL
ncbi:hypothetical protein WR25_03165 [Diploscapter pachys]|uniref:BPTI/Kunitz inhibitor domain-containing protein n=1 Tax=Diploscapter pachys TaxID=2018661 RepID=A0A2A2K358_9BILA|nr:hypothetical protein WR25_03165 [Diploscapter pachys]